MGSDDKRIVLFSQRKLSNYINEISNKNKYSIGLLSFRSKQILNNPTLFERNEKGEIIYQCGWSEKNIFGFKIYNLKEYYNIEELISKYESKEEIERRINETTVACLTKLYSENLNFLDYENKYLKNIELLLNNNENIFLFE